MQKILSGFNTKIAKGEKLGYFTTGIHFAPHTLSGRNVCPFASKGCAAACLNTAGMGVYGRVQRARIKKTQAFHADPQGFIAQLISEIKAAGRKAQREGMILALRLNLTSDIAWEKIIHNGKNIFQHFPEVIFYDYTKNHNRMMDFLKGKFPKNYSLTFSRSESNHEKCMEILKEGGNVAIVFRGKLPKKWNGFKVINGDVSDTRFLDPKNCVVGLVQKGRAKRDQSGFVVESNPKGT